MDGTPEASHVLCTPSLFATVDSTPRFPLLVALGGEAMPLELLQVSVFSTFLGF